MEPKFSAAIPPALDYSRIEIYVVYEMFRKKIFHKKILIDTNAL